MHKNEWTKLLMHIQKIKFFDMKKGESTYDFINI